MTLRTFVSRRPAWTPRDGLQTVEIFVQARNGPHAARLIREAVDERFVEFGQKKRSAKNVDELPGYRQKKPARSKKDTLRARERAGA